MWKSIILIWIITISTLLAQKELVVDSKVTKATVFRGRALVEREGEIRVKKGINKLVFDELTLSVDDVSARAVVYGNNPLKILDISTELKFTTESKVDKIKENQKKIKELQRLVGESIDRASVHNSKLKFVEGLQAQSLQYYNQKMLMNIGSTKEWDDMLGFVDKNLTGLYDGIRKENLIQEGLREEINLLEREIESSGGERKNFKRIVVTVDAEIAEQVTAAVNYMVSQASWYPSYDARTSIENQSLELSYYGNVNQSTGEEWKDISLTLSTANPSRFKSLPQLDSWFIGTKPQKKYSNYSGSITSANVNYVQNYSIPENKGNITGYVLDNITEEPMVGAQVYISGTSYKTSTDDMGKFLLRNVNQGNKEIIATYIGYQDERLRLKVVSKNTAHVTFYLIESDINSEEVAVIANRSLVNKNITNSTSMPRDSKSGGKPKLVFGDQVNVAKSTLSTTFTIPTKYTIPSDNSFHKATISRNEMPIELKYSAIPKLSGDVFLSGEFVNNNEYPFLLGNLNMFVNGDLVTKTKLDLIVPNDTVNIALGTDDNLKVNKKMINRFINEGGMLSNTTKIDYHFEISIENNSSHQVKINLKDQIPVSSHEDIEIKITEPKDKNSHILEWKLTLNAGEKRKIPVKYSVSFPEDMQIYGLE